MAATRLIAMHINKGKSLAQCLEARTDYAQNPEKTEKGELVTSYECDPMTCDEEFLLSKRQYWQYTGREQKGDVIAYQIRQSFKRLPTRSVSLLNPGRSQRRRQTASAVNWRWPLPRAGTLSSWLPIRIVPTYTIISSSTPHLWIAGGNSGIISVPA